MTDSENTCLSGYTLTGEKYPSLKIQRYLELRDEISLIFQSLKKHPEITLETLETIDIDDFFYVNEDLIDRLLRVFIMNFIMSRQQKAEKRVCAFRTQCVKEIVSLFTDFAKAIKNLPKRTTVQKPDWQCTRRWCLISAVADLSRAVKYGFAFSMRNDQFFVIPVFECCDYFQTSMYGLNDLSNRNRPWANIRYEERGRLTPRIIRTTKKTIFIGRNLWNSSEHQFYDLNGQPFPRKMLKNDCMLRRHRENIGYGIRLDVYESYQLWLSVTSNHPVFVECQFLDFKRNSLFPRIHVVKPGEVIMIHDLYQFESRLRELRSYRFSLNLLKEPDLRQKQFQKFLFTVRQVFRIRIALGVDVDDFSCFKNLDKAPCVINIDLFPDYYDKVAQFKPFSLRQAVSDCCNNFDPSSEEMQKSYEQFVKLFFW